MDLNVEGLCAKRVAQHPAGHSALIMSRLTHGVVVLDVVEDGGLHVVPLVPMPRSARTEPRPFLLADVDVLEDAVELVLGHLNVPQTGTQRRGCRAPEQLQLQLRGGLCDDDHGEETEMMMVKV